jgi:hypothetical protein
MQYLALLVGAMLVAASASADIDYRLFSRLAPAVLKVEAHNPDGSVSIGSGVTVSDGVVVTNCHVTRRASRIDLVKGGARWAVNTQASDLVHDLCILFAPTATTPVASVSQQKPRVGQTVIAIGYVGGLGPRMNVGEVKALYELDGGRVIQSTAAFSSGASGGGLFDPEGRLIGVIAFKYPGEQAYHFSLPVDWLPRMLEASAAQEIAPLSGGPAFWQHVGEGQPYFLRAAALEAAGEWQKLLALARNWTAAESGNANAWFMLGRAHAQENDSARAVEAYRRAVALEIDNADAWYALGAAYARLGDHLEVKNVRDVLESVDPRLAEALFRNFLLQCDKRGAIATC